MLPEIHTMEKCYLFKPIIHSQIIYLPFKVNGSVVFFENVPIHFRNYSWTSMARTPLEP